MRLWSMNCFMAYRRPVVRNDTELIFTDISSEEYREYLFPQGASVLIQNPTHLHVSKSGGHRILDANGVSHYVPKGWIHLRWKGTPNFVK